MTIRINQDKIYTIGNKINDLKFKTVKILFKLYYTYSNQEFDLIYDHTFHHLKRIKYIHLSC